MEQELIKPMIISNLSITLRYDMDVEKFNAIIKCKNEENLQKSIKKLEDELHVQFNEYFINGENTKDAYKIKATFMSSLTFTKILEIIKLLRNKYKDMNYEYFENEYFSINDLSFFNINEQIYEPADELFSLKIFDKNRKLLNVRIFDINYDYKEE